MIMKIVLKVTIVIIVVGFKDKRVFYIYIHIYSTLYWTIFTAIFTSFCTFLDEILYTYTCN